MTGWFARRARQRRLVGVVESLAAGDTRGAKQGLIVLADDGPLSFTAALCSIAHGILPAGGIAQLLFLDENDEQIAPPDPDELGSEPDARGRVAAFRFLTACANEDFLAARDYVHALWTCEPDAAAPLAFLDAFTAVTAAVIQQGPRRPGRIVIAEPERRSS